MTDVQTAPAEPKGKSIVNDKYKGRKNSDWVTGLIEANATAMKTVTKTVKVEGSDETKKVEEQKPAGVSIDGLFTLAKVNHLNVDKYEAQRDHHGFAGRFRMTVANMLRARARGAHGLFTPGKDGADPAWNEAPAEWLQAQGVEGEPTLNRDGTKIKREKPAVENAAEATKEAPEGEGESVAG